MFKDTQILEEAPEKTKRSIYNDLHFQAVQLAYYHAQWKGVGAPRMVLKVSLQYHIPFVQKLPIVLPNSNEARRFIMGKLPTYHISVACSNPTQGNTVCDSHLKGLFPWYRVLSLRYYA